MFASFNARAIGLAALDAVTTIDLAARTGFEGVDLMVRDIVETGADPLKLRAIIDRHDLKAGAFPFPIEWRKDLASYRKGLESLPPLLEAAKILGLTRTGTWVMPETPDRESSIADVARLHIDRLGTIARLMNESGIRIGLEVIGVETFRTGRGKPFVTRLADLDQVLGALWNESPNLGVLVDAFHLYAAKEPLEAGLAWGVNRIVWVHVADLPPDASGDRATIIDSNRGLPGENGAIDVKTFLAELAQHNYDGPVTAEPLSNCRSLAGLSPLDQVRRVKAALDQAWPGS